MRAWANWRALGESGRVWESLGESGRICQNLVGASSLRALRARNNVLSDSGRVVGGLWESCGGAVGEPGMSVLGDRNGDRFGVMLGPLWRAKVSVLVEE